MPDTWRSIAERKAAERDSRIPSEWRLARSYSHLDNVLSVPRDSGLLSSEELRLTEDYDATALLAGLANGMVTSVAVTTAFCKRSAIAQQCCNCLTEIFYEDALERAKNLDALFAQSGRPIGPLHGLPISLKETFKVTGYDASIGFADLCFQPAEENSALVDLLLELGAVLYCKTNIPQAVSALDSMNNIFGRTLNPMNRHITAGGSSGGEGALVAMRGSILGVGTDVAGSIRVPAAANQLYGVKPSHGRIPYSGQQGPSPPGADKLGLQATAGPIATTLRDCELFMQIICDSMPTSHDQEVIPQPWQSQLPLSCCPWEPQLLRPLRVGIVVSDNHVEPLPPILELMREVYRTLDAAWNKRNIEVVEVNISTLGAEALKVVNGFMSIDGGNAYLDHVEKTGEPLSRWNSTRVRRRKGKSAEEVRELHAKRADLMARFTKLFDGNRAEHWVHSPKQSLKEDDEGLAGPLDVLIAPNAPHPIPPIDRWNTVNYTGMWNLVDFPCGVLPVRSMTQRDLQCEFPPDSKPLNSWDKANRELWTNVDRRVYLGSPLNIQVIAPRLMERVLVDAMMVLDRALSPLRAQAEREKLSKL